MNKGILLFHPAGIGDCVLDISNVYQLILDKSRCHNIYYACNIYAKPIIECTDIENYAKVHYLDYPNKFSLSDIIFFYQILSKIDIMIVFAGMNLKKISYIKIFFPKKIKLYGALANLPPLRLKEIVPSNKIFSKIIGPSNNHRVLVNYRLYHYIGLLNNNFIIKGLNKEKIKNIRKSSYLKNLDYDYILIHMGFVNNRSINNSLKLDSWIRLIEDISIKLKIKIIIIGSDQERINVKNFMSKIGGKDILNLCGKTDLNETMYVISKARIVLAIDGAIGHIAAALGKELVSFFGPGNYQDVCPINTRGYIVSKILECNPCYETPNYYSCPFDRTCIDLTNTSIIYDSIKEIIDLPKPAVISDFINKHLKS